jgi:hypothetical protein
VASRYQYEQTRPQARQRRDGSAGRLIGGQRVVDGGRADRGDADLAGRLLHGRLTAPQRREVAGGRDQQSRGQVVDGTREPKEHFRHPRSSDVTRSPEYWLDRCLERYEIWIGLLGGESALSEAGDGAGVDRLTVMKLRQVAKQGAL